MPHKADLVEPRPSLGRHLISALRCNPPSQFQATFFVNDRHATVSVPSFELFKGREILFPKILSPIPNKPNRVQATFAFYRQSALEPTPIVLS
jgi:hypothetical protein